MRNVLVALILVISSTVNSKTDFTVGLTANVDDLFQVLKKARTKNVVEAVSLFDDKFFKKEQYALIFDSLSPQTSSPDAPRVLLFGKDKKLRVGFNHHKKDGQELEIIQFRDTTKTWEFREIKFSKNGPTMSPPNPSLCIQCHDDYKPKFDGKMMQFLRNTTKGRINISPFVKKIKTDPIYRRLENPPKTLN